MKNQKRVPIVAGIAVFFCLIMLVQYVNLHNKYVKDIARYSSELEKSAEDLENFILSYDEQANEIKELNEELDHLKAEIVKYRRLDSGLYEDVNLEALDHIFTSARYNGGLVAINHPIEMKYINDEISDYSTVGMQMFMKTYSDLWIEEMEKYESLILDMDFENGKIPELFTDYNDARKTYLEAQLVFYRDYNLEVSIGGSEGRLNTSADYMGIYREHALKTMRLYDVMSVGQGYARTIEW